MEVEFGVTQRLTLDHHLRRSGRLVVAGPGGHVEMEKCPVESRRHGPGRK